MKTLALCLLWAVAASVFAQDAGWSREFDILDSKQKSVGQLSLSVAQRDGVTTVQRAEQMKLKKFLIRAEVTQQVTEIWRDGQLQSLEAVTEADTSLMDKRTVLTLQRQGDELVGTANDEPVRLPASQWPASVWRQASMTTESIFDLNEGQPAQLTAQSAGLESVPGGQCERFDAQLRAERGSVSASYWFDGRGRLCQQLSDSGFGELRYVMRMPTP